jgi:glycyl-tRNA synthetase beta chain
MPDLILEVGTEEMPAGAVEDALMQLAHSAIGELPRARLGDPPLLKRQDELSIHCYGTPRRLILKVQNVRPRQPDIEREVRGPAKSVAYDAEGRPTGAAQGFARKQGVPVESLETVSTPQGDYVLARVTDKGKPALEVLGPVLADAVKKLFFPKMMRWGQGAMRFVRPIRWILALLDGDVIPMEIAGVASDRKSRGHRFLAPEEFEVANTGEFLERLRAVFVMYDPVERRQAIREQADRLAGEAGGSVPWDEGLLDENNWLVEWPTALVGRFDPAFLDLPRPVLVTAMKKHQRFFPVEDAWGRLLPLFIAIRNGGSERLDIVREGNERVLTARFSDARHFYEKDRQTPLAQMAEGLGRLVFQEKLGTMAEKRRRLEVLVGALAAMQGMNAEMKTAALRAARLCKADLISQMVVELPALQGVIGREYALASGENPLVADALAEHYLPRAAGDALPETWLGKMLAVADRMDTLVGYAGLGIMPSGSSDPYGLRRAAQGIVQILAREPEGCPLLEIQVQAAHAYQQVNKLDFELDPLCNSLQALFDQRIAALLEELGIRYDLIDAALSGGALYTTLVYSTLLRAKTLQSLTDDPNFIPTVQAAARVANILRSANGLASAPLIPGKEGIHGESARAVERAVSVLESESRSVHEALLREPAERALYDAATSVMPEVARRATDYEYAALYRELDALRAPVNTFFDDVLVMTEDATIRRNRLALLSFIDALYKTLADFTKVVVA